MPRPRATSRAPPADRPRTTGPAPARRSPARGSDRAPTPGDNTSAHRRTSPETRTPDRARGARTGWPSVPATVAPRARGARWLRQTHRREDTRTQRTHARVRSAVRAAARDAGAAGPRPACPAPDTPTPAVFRHAHHPERARARAATRLRRSPHHPAQVATSLSPRTSTRRDDRRATRPRRARPHSHRRRASDQPTPSRRT